MSIGERLCWGVWRDIEDSLRSGAIGWDFRQGGSVGVVMRGVRDVGASELHGGDRVNDVRIAVVRIYCEMLPQRVRGFGGGAGEKVHGAQA